MPAGPGLAPRCVGCAVCVRVRVSLCVGVRGEAAGRGLSESGRALGLRKAVSAQRRATRRCPPAVREGAAEPEPEPQPAEEGVPPEEGEGEAAGGESPRLAQELQKSAKRSNKYSSAPAAGSTSADKNNPLTGGGMPSFTSKPTPVPPSMGGDTDGNFRIVMDKKSPTTVSAWQKRWCVFTPEGKLYYFDSYEASCGELDEEAKKDPLDLTECKRITSNNWASCHVELDLGGKKAVQLRVTKEAMQLPTGSVIKRYDKTKFEQLQQVLNHLETTGVLTCDATIENIGNQTVKKERKELSNRGAVMVLPK